MSKQEKKRAKSYRVVTEEEFRQLGATMMNHDPEGRSERVFLRRWMFFFGVEPDVVIDAWERIHTGAVHDGDLAFAKPEHLLWALLFLKKYGAEEDMSSIAGGVDETTFRKWSKLFVARISFLQDEVVSETHGCVLLLLDATYISFSL